MNNPINDVPHLRYLHNYNDFFFPNICHVCKSANKGYLILCNQCCMISYCSEAHRQMHHLEHLQFCKYLTQYLKERGVEWCSLRSSNSSTWIQSRLDFLYEIMRRFPRRLEPYELQMIVFPKSCRICYRQDQLHTCKTCYSDNYCTDHTQEFQSLHASKCREMKRGSNLNIIDLIYSEFALVYVKFPEQWGPVNDMSRFMTEYVRNPLRKRIGFWTGNEYLYSDYITGPLTLYDGMKNADLLNLPSIAGPQCIVHVMSPNFLERRYVKAWELLLHRLTCIKQLTVVLIGPGLKTESKDIGVCSSCLNRKQNLSFQCYPRLYHEYVDSLLFLQPNMIIRFETYFTPDDERWIYDILRVRRMNCPFIITSGSQFIMKQNVHKIKMLLNVNPAYSKPNNFKSFRPRRQLNIDYIGYRNSYVTVYKNLYSS